MRKSVIIFVLTVAFFVNLFASEECTIGVISGKVTKDGKPLLWKNRDIPLKYRNNDIRYIKGEKYPFLALMTVTYSNYAWAGTNSKGFCIVNSASKDLAGTNKSGLGNGEFLKKALGTCASVNDFEKLLQTTNLPGRLTNCNFGVIDGFGNAAIFETGNFSYTKFDVNDVTIAPNGFIVRANFALTSNGDGGIERYNRANELIKKGIKNKSLDYVYLLQKVARDISKNNTAYTFPICSENNLKPPFSIDTSKTINRNSTSAAVVIQGIKKGESVDLTTMWSILGNPVLSIAVPAWVFSGKSPDSLTGKEGGAVCLNSIKIYDLVYFPIVKEGKTVEYLSTLQLPFIQKHIFECENIIIEKTEKFLKKIKNKNHISKNTLAEFQDIAGKLANSYMKKIVTYLSNNKILKVGVYADYGASPVCVTETIAALEIDKGMLPIAIKGSDITNGILNSLDAIVFPGGSGSKEACSMGSISREKIRKFVLEQGKGCVGICAGGYLLSSTPVYPWSLKLTSSSVFDRAHYNRGRGLIEISLSKEGKKIFPELSVRNSIFLQYYDGPVLVREKSSNLPKYLELGRYITDIHLTGNSKVGITPGKTALLLNNAGKGKVFVVVGHPEATPGMRWMVPRMVRIVTNSKLIKYPETVVRPERETKAILFDQKRTKLEKQLFWKLVGENPSEQINALRKLVEMRSRPALRWAIGLLRDKDKKVVIEAAKILQEAEYTPSIGDLEIAYRNATDKKVKKVLKQAVNHLKTIINAKDK
jgi:hypothetical protein